MTESQKTLRLVGEVDHFAAYRLVDVIYLNGEYRKTAYQETAIGNISASTTCKVLIEGPEVRAALDAKQARELAHSLNHAAYQAEQRTRVVRGETVRRVRIGGDSVTVTYSGETMPMRLQRTRSKWAQCCECRQHVSESWASYRITDKGWGPRPRVGEIRICKECLPKLKVDNPAAPMLVG